MSILGRRRRSGGGGGDADLPRRRSGPTGEAHWWDDQDQTWVEQLDFPESKLGPGWRRFKVINNQERLDPLGSGPDADLLRSERDARRLTALDEGRAWRRPSGSSLLVARYEVFAGRPDAHREAWQRHARGALDATWRDRWRERDRTPGWIEARWLDDELRPVSDLAEADELVDWIRVEDHTGDGRKVTVYHHLTLWAGRFTATLVQREALGADLDPAPARLAQLLAQAAADRGV